VAATATRATNVAVITQKNTLTRAERNRSMSAARQRQDDSQHGRSYGQRDVEQHLGHIGGGGWEHKRRLAQGLLTDASGLRSAYTGCADRGDTGAKGGVSVARHLAAPRRAARSVNGERFAPGRIS
jgi:hypothetical protein